MCRPASEFMIKFIENIMRNAKLVGIISLILSLATWILDWFGLVYACPYCRIQRTIIGLIGLFMFLPSQIRSHWLLLFTTNILAFFGAYAGASQHFLIWMKFSNGQIDLLTMLVNPSFWMSLGAMIFIGVQFLVLNKFSNKNQFSIV